MGIARRLRAGIGGAFTHGGAPSAAVVISDPIAQSVITTPHRARDRDVAWVTITYGPIDPEFAEIYRSAITREVRPTRPLQPVLHAGVQPADVIPELPMRLAIIVRQERRPAFIAPLLWAGVPVEVQIAQSVFAMSTLSRSRSQMALCIPGAMYQSTLVGSAHRVVVVDAHSRTVRIGPA